MATPHSPPVTSKRQHIEDTLTLLLDSLGDICAAELERIRDSLCYKAPELMDHTWLRIRDVLVRRASDHAGAGEIWNAACAAYPTE